MGFLKSFLGAMVANDISEKKRQEQEQRKSALNSCNNVDKIITAERLFLDYLRQLNCRNVEYKDLITDEQIENYSTTTYDVLHAQQVIDRYKQQLKEFMSFGGDPQYVKDLDRLDLYIDIVKRLKEYDWLDKQEQYVKYAEDMDWLDRDWADEQDRRRWISKILELPNNEIKKVIKKSNENFIAYNNPYEQSLYIENAAFAFYSSSVSIKLTEKHIIVYSNIYGPDYEKTPVTCCYTHEEIYYKSTIENRQIDISFEGKLSSEQVVVVSLNDLQIRIKEEEFEEIQNFYKTHNENISNGNRVAYESINSLSGIEFENLCQRLLENMGFKVETTKTTGDGGIDLIAYNSQPLLSGKYIIQCKRYIGSVGEPVIRDLYGVITSERANKGILMTSGTFTKQAQVFAQEKPIELIDGVKLQELLENYYN